MENGNGRSAVIVGAGLSGLTCAVRLAQKGFKVTVVEKNTYPGGLLASSRVGKEYLELMPHHLRKSDKALLSLAREMGVDDRIEWFDALFFGKAAKKKVGYFKNGFVTLIHSLTQTLVDNGGTILYSTTVYKISKKPRTDERTVYSIWLALNDSSHTIECDYLLYTGSCRNFVTLSGDIDMDMDIRDALMDIKYQNRITLMMILKKNCSEVYFQYMRDAMTSFSRIVFHSNCFGLRDYGGHVVYLVGSCDLSDPLWISADADIMDKYFKEFRKTYPGIKKSDIKAWRLTKIRYALSDKYPTRDLTNPAPHIYVCASGLTHFGTDEVPENRMDHVVALANRISEKIVSEADSEFSEHEAVIPLIN